MSDKKGPERLTEGTLISHLLELRDRLLRAVLAIVVAFVPAAWYHNQLFELLARPWIKQLRAGSTLIATGVTTNFIVPFKLAFVVAIFAAMPVVIYQIWAFVAPGLYRREKRFAMPLLVSAIVLFYAGTAFCYLVVFPAAFKFFTHNGPAGVPNMTDIGNYVDFAIRIFLAFGVAFEIPVVVVLLTMTGLVPVEKLTRARGYVVIGIFVLAAIVTPPDPLSQVSMALPMWLLYESGVLMARMMNRKRNSGEAKEDKSDDEPPAA